MMLFQFVFAANYTKDAENSIHHQYVVVVEMNFMRQFFLHFKKWRVMATLFSKIFRLVRIFSIQKSVYLVSRALLT